MNSSPWPILTGFGVFSVGESIIGFFHGWNSSFYCLTTIIALSMAVSMWWRDVVREGTFLGEHTQVERKAFWVGFILFVCTEVMFFVSLFWAFFHSALAPAVELGCVYPPVGILPVPIIGSPLVMTGLLVGSGVLANWSLHAVKGDEDNACEVMLLALMMSVFFSYYQAMEYYEASFTIRDSVYGSVFFLITGFHGIHVTGGTIFLIVQVFRMFKGHFSTGHHLGLDMAVLYWHFVDVIWILVIVFVYGWGGL
uniref:Cytochrome c oxidase subunit 3 n=2 Tax=Anadara TaxID=6554 RepID=A0A088BI15_9BIVA|nr:cytochrome c oxidase subunit III [Anadara sativa]AHB14365.1 cytochrome c oxidase subunit III [Anadara sativa]UVJ66740.1 cytochrome c oxidase subunit III [Anadara broughtonii]BAN00312.1 cytochrome c oxidase subunit III [Anadara broughtonii]